MESEQEVPEVALIADSPAVAEIPAVPEVSELDRVLIAFGAAGHGRLFCTCGHLIWSCPCKTGCYLTPRMIETDHTLCKKKKK